MANTLQGMRRSVDLTQEQLAAVIETDRSTVAKWETGSAYPRAPMLPRLAVILGVSEGEIIAAITAARESA